MTNTDTITDGQIRSLRTGISTIAGKDNAAHVYIVQQLIDRPVTALRELKRHEWQRLRDSMYPYWPDEDWTLGDEFRVQCVSFFEKYREDVLGQRRLF